MIQKYYDGELDPTEQARFEAHRSGCAECSEMERDFLEVFSSLERLEPLQPAADFDSRVMAGVDTGRYRESLVRKLMRDLTWKWNAIPAWARVAGSITAAFVFFMYVFRPVYLEMVEVFRKAVIFMLSALVLLRRAEDLYDRVINYLDSSPGFLVAARVLMSRTVQFVKEIPAGYYVIGILVSILIIYMMFKLTRTSWRKGESNVSVI
jgi:hypothetical protein